jgi:hypothetical protein
MLNVLTVVDLAVSMEPTMDRVSKLVQQVPPSSLLGYLNFSDGRPDSKFQRSLNEAYTVFAQQGETSPWISLRTWLLEQADQLEQSGSSAFKDLSQAKAIIDLALNRSLAAYRNHHSDLLAHQSDAAIFTPFFLARVCEMILSQGGPWNEVERVVPGVVNKLNDYVGHRPVAILETRPQTELYPQEKLRPVPIYLRGVGASYGAYQAIVEEAIRLLESTDDELTYIAEFDLNLMDELAFDPRAYDHDHPVNRRPNYLFGEWDPHHIDNRGRYRRFVVRQTVLDALFAASKGQRTLSTGSVDRLFESAAVLAGTILMASGISGEGPTSHDSDTKLATLIPKIARYRDEFYKRLIEKVPGELGEQLRIEASRIRQPFGGIRQQLNQELSKQRAFQLQEGHLALLFAEIGYPTASRQRAARIPASSVRIRNEIRLRQTSADLEISKGNRIESSTLLTEIEDLIERGIHCGAIADPWNILGYQGLYPLFQSREDSVRDHRNDELIEMMSRQFDLYARLLAVTASAGDQELQGKLTRSVRRLADWWNRFATFEVSDVTRLHGGERADAALHVAKALAKWSSQFDPSNRESNTELQFWRQQRDGFATPSGYAQVVEALLRQHQWRASMALLMAWLSETDTIALEEGEASFHRLAKRWLSNVIALPDMEERSSLIRRFFDLLEVNGESLWGVPELPGLALRETGDDSESKYESAYESVTYKDSANDGEEGAVIGNNEPDDFALEEQSKTLEQRLQFLNTIAHLWQMSLDNGIQSFGKTDNCLAWLQSAGSWHEQLINLLDVLHDYPIPKPGTGVDEIIEFDRRRHFKDRLLETTISTTIEVGRAVRALCAIVDPDDMEFANPWDEAAVAVEQAIAINDPELLRSRIPQLISSLKRERSLFIPLSEGGDPRQILQARAILTLFEQLLNRLPKLGLIRETYHLVRLAKSMEQNGPAEGRKVSEFDQLFKIALRSVVETLLIHAERWDIEHKQTDQANEAIVTQSFSSILSTISNEFLRLWIEHSTTLRLAAVEAIGDQNEWNHFRDFIRKYGREIFTADFMMFGNLRGILHQGIGEWLDSILDRPDEAKPERLIDDLQHRRLSRQRAIHYLETLMMAVAENYEEYRDYNTTTTQSDYGENLFVLMDFLRLKIQYDRFAWRMKPLLLAHEVLCRRGHIEIAESWRERVGQESKELSETLLSELNNLELTHAIRLRTIRDRIEERFIHPLLVDRLCALIEPASYAARNGADESSKEFRDLEAQLQPLAENPIGVGLDAPQWIRRVETETARVQTILQSGVSNPKETTNPLTLADLQLQIAEWNESLG